MSDLNSTKPLASKNLDNLIKKKKKNFEIEYLPNIKFKNISILG